MQFLEYSRSSGYPTINTFIQVNKLISYNYVTLSDYLISGFTINESFRELFYPRVQV